MADQKKTWVYVLGGILIGFFLFAGLVRMMWDAGGIPHTQPPPPNYTQIMCDDAFKQQGPPPEATLDHFDLTLNDGCFSAMYAVPDGWRYFNMQLLGKDKADWISMWPQSSNQPFGPYSYDQFNFGMDNWKQQNLNFLHGAGRFRLQGKGTVRVYRTAN
jgi:hypothetical protein